MKKIHLNTKEHADLTIMIFVEGTILKPKTWLSLYSHNSYVPIGNAVNIINSWQQQGANIIYCTSRKSKHADNIADNLKKHGFSGAYLVARELKESYAELVEAVQPDVLIEDDCKSIGGAWQMCITKVNSELKRKIKSVIVPEFKGIDNLSVNIEHLLVWKQG